MSKLDSLIRLHERTLDEARRELGRAEAAVASAAAAIDALEAEIKAEQAAAGHTADVAKSKSSEELHDAAFEVNHFFASLKINYRFLVGLRFVDLSGV